MPSGAQKMDPNLAIQVMLEAGLKPLVKYPGSGIPWKCRCMACKRVVTPQYRNVKSGHKGCRSCAHTRVTAGIAEQVMRGVDFKPLEPYPGDTKAKWRCKCLRCKVISTPRYVTALNGKRCGRCAGFGFNPNESALVYVLENCRLSSIKIGITKVNGNRLKMFADAGWRTVETYFFEHGHEARSVEGAVLRRIRKDLQLPPHLTKSDMDGMNGWTETVSSNLLPAQAVCSMVEFHMIANAG